MRTTRRFQIAVTVGVLLAIGMASLSDSILRGPGGKVSAFLFRLGLRIIPGTGAFTAGGYLDLPFGKDTVAHFVAWSLVGLVAAGVFRRWPWRVALFLALFTLSALIEVGQQYLSWSRSAELSDLAANGFGLAVGFGFIIAAEFGLRVLLPNFDFRKPALARQPPAP